MNHLRWMGHSSTIMDIQRALRNDNESCEVTLVAKDGLSVRAHLFVLSTCSDLMRTLLVDVPPGQEATIVLPDIRGELLESMLSFIYMGETNLQSSCLTEFLEAINLLGIKSAISFECNTTAMSSTSTGAGSIAAVEAAKSISGLHIEQAELLEEEEATSAVVAKLEVSNSVIAEPQEQHQHEIQAARSLEYIDVYTDQPKITYSIEHMDGTTSGNQFILTENTGTFTITQAGPNPVKMDTAEGNISGVVANNESESVMEDDVDGDATDDVDDSQLIEAEYTTGADPLIEMATDANMGEDECLQEAEIDEEDMLEIKSRKIITLKQRIRRTPAQKAKEQREYAVLKQEIKMEANDALELAAHSVLQEGLSLQKAADRYGISKTVLWRRVRTNPEYMKHSREKPSLTEAYERLKNGDSLKSISQDLHIPMSTLHRHKVRLSQEGRLPDFVACRRRDSTPKDELRDKLAKAVHACINEGMSQNHAANLFEIPKSTLWRHLQRRMAEADIKKHEPVDDDDGGEEILA